MSYWIYQHLGNLSPEQIEREGILDRLIASDDAGGILRRWALKSEEFTPVPGGYPFSYGRHLGGGVHLVVMDSRNGRVLTPGARSMLDDDEWAFVADECREPCRHLVIATSLPMFVPGGLHGIQQWNEAVCDGAWGRPFAWLGEKLRRALDMEDWAAFDRSFRADGGSDRRDRHRSGRAGDGQHPRGRHPLQLRRRVAPPQRRPVDEWRAPARLLADPEHPRSEASDGCWASPHRAAVAGSPSTCSGG